MDYVRIYDSPLGRITITSDGENLTGLWFEGQKHRPSSLSGHKGCPPVLQETERWLNLYFSGNDPGFTPPLRMEGTVFQKDIWKILLTVPYGNTATYGEIANTYASAHGCGRMSAQAVGGAVSRNPISIIVPCHRVLGANGNMTGYAGGLWRKEALLKLEQSI